MVMARMLTAQKQKQDEIQARTESIEEPADLKKSLS
jgi:hypothetical protein